MRNYAICNPSATCSDVCAASRSLERQQQDAPSRSDFGAEPTLRIRILAVDRQTGSSMNSFDAVVYLALVDCRGHRLQRRPAAQRGHDPGLSGRDADRGWVDVAGRRLRSANAGCAADAEFGCCSSAIFLAAGMVLGKLARMALDEAIGPGAGIGDRLGGALLGAVRVGLVAITLVLIFDQVCTAWRRGRLGRPAARRFAAAAVVVGGRATGLPVAAARRRRAYRSAEATTGGSRHGADRLICISAGEHPLSGPPELATVSPSDFKKSSDITGVRQWILGSKAAAPSFAHPARAWDAPARSRWPTRACMSR